MRRSEGLTMDPLAVVTPVEIARLAGVGRAAVANWRKRHADFPQPVGGTPASPTFRLSEVEAWLRSQDKVTRLAPDELAWQQIRAITSDHDLASGVVLAGQFILAMEQYTLHMRRRPGVHALLAEQNPDTIVREMEKALSEWQLPGMPTPRMDGRHVVLLHALADMVTVHGTARSLDVLVDRLHETTRRPRTPDAIASLMVAMVGPGPKRIFDPACGTGTLLTTAARTFANTWIYGDDANRAAVNLSTLRLLAEETSGRQFRACGLRDAQPLEHPADAVVCVPPYGERDWSSDDLAYDARWQYGIPPRMEPELAWVQHAVANVRPGGRVVMLLPPAVAARPSGRRIRAELLRRGALRAVVALPTGAAPPYNLGLHLWILRRPAHANDSGDRVLIADTTPRLDGDESGTTINWTGITNVLFKALSSLDAGTEPPSSPAVMISVFPVMELLDDDVDISPARRLYSEPEPVDGAQVARLRDTVATHLGRLSHALPAFGVVPTPQPLPAVVLGDLVRTGAARILARATRRNNADTSTPAEDTVPLWRAQDVISGEGPSARLPRARLSEDATQVQSGDVLVPMSGPRLAAMVVTEVHAGAVLGPHMYLIRPEPSLLDPWFLAGFLRRDTNAHRSTSLGSIQRYDIRRAQIPRVPLEDQQRHGRLFQRIAEFESLLREVAGAGGDMMKLIADGLAAGTLLPTVSTEKGT